MRTRKKRVMLEEGTYQDDPSGITIQLGPGLQEKYRRVLFYPDAFETLLHEGLIEEGGFEWDGEFAYDLGSRYRQLMSFLDHLRAEAQLPRKGRKKAVTYKRQ